MGYITRHSDPAYCSMFPDVAKWPIHIQVGLECVMAQLFPWLVVRWELKWKIVVSADFGRFCKYCIINIWSFRVVKEIVKIRLMPYEFVIISVIICDERKYGKRLILRNKCSLQNIDYHNFCIRVLLKCQWCGTGGALCWCVHEATGANHCQR